MTIAGNTIYNSIHSQFIKNLSKYENKYLYICVRNSSNSYTCDKPNEKFYF